MAKASKASRRDTKPSKSKPSEPATAAAAANVINKIALAKLKGVTKSAITKACLPGGPLAAAQLPTGRIDLDHPATVAWLGAASSASSPAPSSPAQQKPPSAKDLKSLGDFSPEEFVDRYGSLQSYVDFVDARKKTAETQRIELQNAETAGRLISRELVMTHVFGFIDSVTRRLLSDTTKTLVRRAYAMASAGAPIEDAQRVASELVTATLTPMKESSERTLRERK